ncbi:hypothetical protein Gorai_007599 [Gossypium raimondii]|uniref:Reverse transcriptase zinc-binding domain-containing protein n=1 Tax=Gossypium raimondii TaxID=29730 RepID=A0A7J8Q945_GOSRA|nr:hypothetical protein [Gossypium raimondii]
MIFIQPNLLTVCYWKTLNPLDNKWKLIWTLDAPQRVLQFLWLVLKEQLLTKMECCKRGVSTNPSCVICGEVEESCIHILRDYCIAWKTKPSRPSGSMSNQSGNYRWIPSPTRSIKINIDGADNPSSGFATSIAVARDEHGKWLWEIGTNMIWMLLL